MTNTRSTKTNRRVRSTTVGATPAPGSFAELVRLMNLRDTGPSHGDLVAELNLRRELEEAGEA